jgi:hypothetical protein
MSCRSGLREGSLADTWGHCISASTETEPAKLPRMTVATGQGVVDVPFRQSPADELELWNEVTVIFLHPLAVN